MKLKLPFKNLVTLLPNKNMLVSFLYKNKWAIIIVVAQNKAKAIEGIKLIKTQKEIKPKKLWVKFREVISYDSGGAISINL